MVVLLTDGRANIGLDGSGGRARAEADATSAAGRIRGAFPAVLVDIAPRAQPLARDLAATMGAIYVPLPYANASALSRAVLKATSEASRNV